MEGLYQVIHLYKELLVHICKVVVSLDYWLWDANSLQS
jgi:hypothetical protein